MKKKFFLLVASVMMMSLVCGCAGRGNEEEHNDVLSFEQAKAEESALVSTDEIIALVKSDTTHKKVVYWFDILCQPCRHHLQHEIAEFYANHDTAEWHIYLVAGLNGLHHSEPDAEGNLVEEAPAENIRHFAKEYRKLLPSLGFDMKDVYLHYDPVLESSAAYKEKYPEGDFFSQLANAMFHSDVAFRCEHDGIPRLFVADRTGQLLTDYYILVNKELDTLDAYYVPNDYYQFDIKDFNHHDTVVGVMMK